MKKEIIGERGKYTGKKLVAAIKSAEEILRGHQDLVNWLHGQRPTDHIFFFNSNRPEHEHISFSAKKSTLTRWVKYIIKAYDLKV